MEEIIIYAIATVILVGSWVANLLRKQHEERQAQTRGGGDAGDPRTTRQRLDELAAKRREELRAQAQARRERDDTNIATRRSASRQPDTQPQNLTMAERAERERARAQYEERARRLREQQQKAAQRQSRQGPPQAARQAQQAQPSASTARGGGAAAQVEAARRRAQRDEAERQKAQIRARQEAAKRKADEEARRRARLRERRESATPVEQPPEAQRQRIQRRRDSSELFARHAGAYTKHTATRHPKFPFVTARTLREAVVMREILDRPRAARDPIEERERGY